ncbi:MAG TPA: hypothetical protein VK090_02355 [Paracoccaceae bacterium]|nr:hypothetical protein [Paracoccaceae bacterium]
MREAGTDGSMENHDSTHQWRHRSSTKRPATPMRFFPLLCVAVLFGIASVPQIAGSRECPDLDDQLLFHSCHGDTSVELLLLPEQEKTLTEPGSGETLVVGGTYTGADRREGDLPNPVGLFIHQGQVISPNLARMDGILIIGGEDGPSVHHASRVPLGSRIYDLTAPEQRHEFATEAARQGYSVMQSHLLIADGDIDVRERPEAKTARRRMFFSGPSGFGVYRTARAVTLFDAAKELEAQLQPEMALNLDMGSYDYCLALQGGRLSNCGVLSTSDTGKLSNALRLSNTGR